MLETLLVTGITALVSGGVVWGTTKSTLNGTVARVERIEIGQTALASKVQEIAVDVAFIKGSKHQEELDKESQRE